MTIEMTWLMIFEERVRTVMRKDVCIMKFAISSDKSQ